jgi:hypothetical protein
MQGIEDKQPNILVLQILGKLQSIPYDFNDHIYIQKTLYCLNLFILHLILILFSIE